MEYAFYERLIDTNTTGKYDTTPILADPGVFAQLIEDLADGFEAVDIVVGLEALGFCYAAPLAIRLRAGFVPLRRAGKLPLAEERLRRASTIDYSSAEKTFEMRSDAIKPGMRVIIADDWLETGAQVRAAISIVESLGGVVVGIALLAAERTDLTDDLFGSYAVHAIRIFER